MEPADNLRVLLDRWRVIALAVLVAAAIGWLTAPAEAEGVEPGADSYTATATLVKAPGSDQSMSYLAVFVTGDQVSRAAADKVGYTGDPALLAKQLRVTPDDTVGSLTISTTDPSAKRATERVAAFVSALRAKMEDQARAGTLEQHSLAARLLDNAIDRATNQVEGLSPPAGKELSPVQQTRLDAAKDNLRGLLQQRDSARSDALTASAPLEVVQPATAVPANSTGFAPPSSRAARAALAAAGGLILGCVIALIVGRIDTRLRDRSEVQAVYGLPVLADIPAIPRWARLLRPHSVRADPQGPVAAAYRSLRSALLFSKPSLMTAGGERRSVALGEPSLEASCVLVVSAGSGEGRSSTIINLAASFAETDHQVLVIDCDVRNPQQHVLLGVPRGPGVTDARDGEIAHLVRPTAIAGVSLLQAGTNERGQVALPMTLPRTVDALRTTADVLLLDCPPVLDGTVAMDAMAISDAVVVVCRAGRTTRGGAQRVRELLTRVGVPAFGVALIGAHDNHAPGTGPGSRSRWRHLLRRWRVSRAAQPAHAQPRETRVPVTTASQDGVPSESSTSASGGEQ